MGATTFRQLDVWQLAHAFVLDVYRRTKQHPPDERFGLISQLRRTTVSTAANIAEGFRRRTKPDKARLLNIAQGSLEECRYYLILAQDLGHDNTEQSLASLDRVARMLDGHVRAIVRSMDADGRDIDRCLPA